MQNQEKYDMERWSLYFFDAYCSNLNHVVTVNPEIEILMMRDDSYDINDHRSILETALSADFAWIITAISDRNKRTKTDTHRHTHRHAHTHTHT